MIVNYVKFKNVGPYGNEMQEIQFDNNKSYLYQLIGKNGVGKSSMIRILKIVLYQEYDGVVVGGIANQINKNGYIEANIDSNNHNWTIINEFSPNKVRVYKDGSTEPEDWGKLGDTKDRIKKEIVDMPYYIFNNAISLSLDDFKSFLSMKAADSRNIRDRIFGFYVVNEMMEIMKPEMNKYIAEIDQFNSKIENINQSIETSQAEYNELKEKVKEGSKDQIAELNADIDKLKLEVDGYTKEKDKLDKKVNEIKLNMEYLMNIERKKELTRMEEKLVKLNKEVEDADENKRIKKNKKNTLDTEKQLITSKNALERIDELNTKIGEYETKSNEIIPEKEAIEGRVTKLEEAISKFTESESLIKNRDLIKVAADELTTNNTRHEEILISIGKGETYLEDVNVKLKEGIAKQNVTNGFIADLNKKITAHEQGICSECGTDLTEDEHVKKLDGYKADLELKKGNSEKIDGMLTKLESAKETATTKLDGLKKTKNDLLRKYGDLRVDVSKINGFDKATEFLLGVIKECSITDNLEWDKDELQKNIDLVVIPNADYDVEADKKKLDEEKKILEDKEAKLKGIAESKLGDTSSMNTLKESLQEGITKEKLEETTFSYKSADEYNVKIDELNTEIDEYIETANNNQKELGELSVKVDNLKKEIKPDEDFKDLDTTKIDTNKIEDTLEKGNEEINDYGLKLRKIGENIELTNQHISNKNMTIKSLSSDEHITTQLKSVQSIIDKFKEELEKFNKDIEGSQEHVNFFKSIQYILSDEGIKAYILKDVVPSINSEISKILEMLGVPLTVLFDEEFNVHIYRFGEEVSLSTISTGQKKMTDCAILLSITIILRMKYQFNVTFYDEILSSVDSDNRPILLEIVKEICCNKLKLHTFVVNHDYIPSSYFEYVIKVEHKNNFSAMKIMTQDNYEAQFLRGVGEISKLSEDVMVET